MGYAHYVLSDGREAGYGVEATCDKDGCEVEIDRGMSYLCGDNPDGWRDENEWGCGDYYCGLHRADHSCPNPDCGAYSPDGRVYCEQRQGHEMPHRDYRGKAFTKTEEDDE